MNSKRIYLSSPTMHDLEMKYIQEAFDTNWVAPLGKNVDEFEREMALYIGEGYAAALNSGTAALHLAVKLCDVKAGDLVFCSDLTFSATINPVSYEGGVQVLIDSEGESWNMDPDLLEKAFKTYKQKPKAVIVANLYGTPAKLDQIVELCKHYDVPLIEDAAESLGATYNKRQTGTFGRYNAFSFNGNKIITTSGGGMFLSRDEEAVKKVRFWATQARDPSPHYQHSEIGYNYRMSNIVAGIGRGQLPYLDEHIRRKREIYNTYKDGLKNLPVTMNPYLANSEPNHWLSCLLIDKKEKTTYQEIMQKLEEHNIESRPIWKPMHMQPVFKDMDYITKDSSTNIGSDIFSRGLCLPSDIKMTEEEQDTVISIIKGCFA